MKSTRVGNPWHMTEDLGDGRGLVLFCDTAKRIGPEHLTANRAIFEKMKPAAKCPACPACVARLEKYKAWCVAGCDGERP